MLHVTINAEPRNLPEPLTVADLLDRLGHDRRRVAVEVNQDVVPPWRHAEHRLARATASRSSPWSAAAPTRSRRPTSR